MEGILSHKSDVSSINTPKVKFTEKLFMRIINWYLCKKHYSFIISKGQSGKKGAKQNEPLMVFANGIINQELIK